MRRYSQPKRSITEDAIELVLEANEAAQDELRELIPEVMPDFKPSKQEQQMQPMQAQPQMPAPGGLPYG